MLYPSLRSHGREVTLLLSDWPGPLRLGLLGDTRRRDMERSCVDGVSSKAGDESFIIGIKVLLIGHGPSAFWLRSIMASGQHHGRARRRRLIRGSHQIG
jgi:hypothetical protein